MGGKHHTGNWSHVSLTSQTGNLRNKAKQCSLGVSHVGTTRSLGKIWIKVLHITQSNLSSELPYLEPAFEDGAHWFVSHLTHLKKKPQNNIHQLLHFNTLKCSWRGARARSSHLLHQWLKSLLRDTWQTPCKILWAPGLSQWNAYPQLVELSFGRETGEEGRLTVRVGSTSNIPISTLDLFPEGKT